MAESEGFEPPIALRLCLISSQVHSTGLCQLSEPISVYNNYRFRRCAASIQEAGFSIGRGTNEDPNFHL